jgi:CheY-like chemotaxis protein
MILFLDDEIYARPYADALEEKGLNVDFVTSVWQALSRLENMPDKYELLLLDCMLPANSRDLKILQGYDVKEGLRTGLAFLRYIVDRDIAANLRIVILTNILEEEFHVACERDTRLSGCYRKREWMPHALAERMMNLVGRKHE